MWLKPVARVSFAVKLNGGGGGDNLWDKGAFNQVGQIFHCVVMEVMCMRRIVVMHYGLMV